MKKGAKFTLIVLIIGLIAFIAFRSILVERRELIKAETTETTKPAPQRRSQSLHVRYVVVQPTELVDGINVSGSLLPDEEVNLSFETSGKITEICFEEGSMVRSGELLAKINDAPLQAQLKKLEAELQPTQDRLYRQRRLLEREAISLESYQDAEANLSKLEASIEEIKAKLEQTELRAPFDGIVGLRQVSVGAYASPSTTIATLTSTKRLKIEFSIPERYSSVLKDGAELYFTVEADSTLHYARVYATNSRVDANTRTFQVRAIYNNNDGRLMPGRYVDITLNTQVFKNAIAIPSEAIISEMGIDKVFLYKGGVAQPVNISKGLRTESHTQVLSGLAIGDTVLTSGTMQLRSGIAVVLRNE